MDTDSKSRQILVKFANTSLKLELIKTAFYLKNTSYTIGIDKTIEERNSYKTLLRQKKELKKEEMSAG